MSHPTLKGPAGRVTRLLLALGLAAPVLMVAWLYSAPLIQDGPRALRARNLSLESARNYYAVLGTGTSLVLGLAGVALGFYYYVDKRRIELGDARRERQREMLRFLVERLERIHADVDAAALEGPNTLGGRKSLSAVLRNLDVLIDVMNCDSALLGLNEDDVRPLISLNSFLEPKARLFLEPDPGDAHDNVVARGDWGETTADLPDHIHAARRGCFRAWLRDHPR